MEWFDGLTADRFKHSRPLGALIRFVGGFSAIAALDDCEISDGEMGRIRAKQIDAVTQLVPVTMTVNAINVAIILVLFWNTGSNVFLILWALALASTVAMAVRSWLRSQRAPPVRASLRAARRMVLQAFFLAANLGRAAAGAARQIRANRSDDHCLPDGRNDRVRRIHAIHGAAGRAGLHLDDGFRVGGRPVSER